MDRDCSFIWGFYFSVATITNMTKADLVNEIARRTGIEKASVLRTVESLMETVADSLLRDESVYLRGFGSFVVKKRAAKVARNISKDLPIVVPAHNFPAFKPSKKLIDRVKTENK